MTKVQQKFQQVANTARNMLLVGAGALFGVLKAASDLEESSSKLTAVFKEEAGAARKFIDEQAKLLNRAKADLIDYMGTLQDTFVPFGFARKEARQM